MNRPKWDETVNFIQHGDVVKLQVSSQGSGRTRQLRLLEIVAESAIIALRADHPSTKALGWTAREPISLRLLKHGQNAAAWDMRVDPSMKISRSHTDIDS